MVAGIVASVTCRDFPSLVVAMSTGVVAIRSPFLCFLFVSLISCFLVLGAGSLFRSPFLCSLLASLSSFPFLSLGRGCNPFACSLFSLRFFEFLSFAFLGCGCRHVAQGLCSAGELQSRATNCRVEQLNR